MPDDPRVQHLLDELLESDATPEAVCSSCVELLPVVRDRWRQMCHARAELDALFPPAADPVTTLPDNSSKDITLPSIPGYNVEAVLGVGGMGVVFRARHLRLNRVVALKMALAGAYAGPHERTRFQCEVEAVAALKHPNVVQIYEVGEADGRPYFTMEFVENGSLDDKLAGTPMPAREAAVLVATLAAAVHAAHGAGIVHRDLKPANVLLSADGTPKVSDFGLARRVGDEAGLTRTGTAVGTPSYMAPEQARGHRDSAGPMADVYSLGAILYELLTGRPPFRAETAAETVHQLLSQDPVPPSRLNAKVPRDLETVCLKCLRKESILRYASAAGLEDDLHRFLRGESITARPESRLGRLARRVRRRPVLSAAIAVATLSTLALLGGGAWTLSERAASTRAMEATERAASDDLGEMSVLLRKSNWPEAKAALERARGRLGPSHSVELHHRLDQGTRDLEMAADLEEIRLRLSDATTSAVPLSPEKMYAGAFRKYGLDLLALEPALAMAAVRDSAIRETLLAFLHDWLYWISDADRARVQSVVDRVDQDEWRRGYRKAIASKERDTQRLIELAALPEVAEQPSVILSGLCGSLLTSDHREVALALLSDAQQRHPGDFWINYLLGHFWEQDRPLIAAGYFRAAVALRPGSEQAHTVLGRALLSSGDEEGALSSFWKAFALNPSVRLLKADLAKLLARRGTLEEMRVAWEKLLSENPSDLQTGYGYAQLCLFLGNQEAYRRARKVLFDNVRNSTDDWAVAERSGLACLLLPTSGEELRHSIELVDRASTVGPNSPHPDLAYVQFVQGLAEYRQGRPERAINYLKESAKKLTNRPGPRLVLAMAQFQAGSPKKHKTLAEAILAYNWNASKADHTTAWVSHVLRREAEVLILPNLSPFLAGKHQPQDNDERLALLGVCQFTNRTHAIARLYADAFAADPTLAEDFRSGHRANAARAAALVGCGRGEDAARLVAEERARSARTARDWLRADVAAWDHELDVAPIATRKMLRQRLSEWRSDPDLAGLRESTELDKLPAHERSDWRSLWDAVGVVITRAAAKDRK